MDTTTNSQANAETQLIFAALLVSEWEAMQAWPEEATVEIPRESMLELVRARAVRS